MKDCIIDVENLNHNYSSYETNSGFFNQFKDMFGRSKKVVHALKNVSFQVYQGEIVGLLGPNGAGKTTLLKILSGLIHGSSGNVHVLNSIPQKKEKKFLKQIGMVMGQKSQLLWDIPPLDTLRILRELYDIPKLEFTHRLDMFIDLLSIGNLLKTPVRHLSLGERMKFELVASLIHNPKLLFLDEPTIGLDIVSQRAIRDFLKSINQTQGTTILITSHYMRDMEVLAQRLMIIKKGLIFYNASLKELLKQFEHENKVFFTPENNNFQLSLPYEQISCNEYAISCTPNEIKHVITEVVKQIPLVRLRTEETSLEDTIFKIFKDEG